MAKRRILDYYLLQEVNVYLDKNENFSRVYKT